MLPDGYPPIDSYEGLAGDAALREMRGFADAFREANSAALARYARHWVPDPLHHWSRRWEYVYVYERLHAHMSAVVGAGAGARSEGRQHDSGSGDGHNSRVVGGVPGARLLDAGSGLTFFPHFLATHLPVAGIVCCDRDPLIRGDAALLQPPASPAVTYSTQDLGALELADGELDAVYCISVLEHSDRRGAIIEEFARVLRPGGLLILTIDISRSGAAEIPADEAERLVEQISSHFDPIGRGGVVRGGERGAVVTTGFAHALDPTLLPWTPAPGQVLRRLLRPWSFPWARALRRLIRRSGGAPAYPDLTFYCMTWRRPGGGAEADA